MNWKHKFSSRKFWLAVAGFVVPLLIAFGVTETEATEVAGIIMAGGSLISYILAEGWADAERAKTLPPVEPQTDEEPQP